MPVSVNKNTQQLPLLDHTCEKELHFYVKNEYNVQVIDIGFNSPNDANEILLRA